MKESIKLKLESLSDRYDELAALLSEAEVIMDQDLLRAYSKEYAELEPVVKCFDKYQQVHKHIEEAEVMMTDSDPEMKEMAVEEMKAGQQQQDVLQLILQKLLLPKDPNDSRNVFLEVRAGTGGDEASIFSGDLFRMYCRYAETQRWKVAIVSASEGEHGGYKEVIAQIVGDGAYSKLKFESGVHRVQRVPATESQGRIHTSACTVAVMPEMNEVTDTTINKSDLRIDTFRASGAGGQHVNKTDSAIRLTHIPTGVVVECQEERSQHKNRAKAMSLLTARLLAAEQEKAASEHSEARKLLIGSGARSERIRTYNYPQGRVTDHRINLTLYKLDEIVTGNLDVLSKPLVNEFQAEQLAALNSEN